MLRIIILIGALGAGVLAAWLALSVQSGASTPTAVVETVKAPTIDVLVASSEITQGQKLSGENLRWQSWPEEAANPGFITRSAKPDAVESLNGSVVRSHFVAGEPIQEKKLARGEAILLAANLASGMRAVAIRVSAESSAGGFILPNNRVDVIHTVAAEGQGGGQAMSRTILRNIRVLAIDQQIDETKGEAAVIGKTATLELDSAQAEIISGAQASGVLSLALRSIEDRDEAPTAAKTPVAQAPKPQSSTSVRILRAGRSETVTIR